ncbi:3'-5' exonuclease [Paenibacillus aurantius]|uniref:3'-5' exonuclease n=1 Tax=Paenibacillus aurantius TaxID=2918900 RepID=A0AA96LHJ3_9BACL|nr:3'-5' exonuclease [Paenibacillus aurantius]WNQ12170.1 3'-5' exonuclease [Paenibacillus aurantius]
MKITHLSDSDYSIEGLILDELGSRRFCVFDLEATGPDPDEDFITQIGAVCLDGDGLARQSFQTLVKSPKPIPPLIEKLTGIRNADLTEAPSFREALDAFRTYAGDAVLVTQAGYEYDWPLLHKECERNSLPAMTNPILDTKVLFAYLHEVEE